MRILLSSLAALAFLQAPALAQKPSLLPFLPQDTLLVVAVPDLDASIGEFSNMPLAKIWREEEVQNFVREARELARHQIDKLLARAKEMHEKGAFPVDPDKLLNLRLRGGTLAITHLGIENGGAEKGGGEKGGADKGGAEKGGGEKGGGEPMPKIGLMLHLDFGDTAEQWFGLLQMGLGMLQQHAGDMVERTEAKVGDAQVISLVPKTAPPGMEMGLHIALLKDGIVLATLKDDLRATVESMQAGKHVLAATDRYKANVKHLTTEGAEAQLYIRPDVAIDFVLKALGVAAAHEPDLAWLDVEGLSRAVDALGLRAVQSIGATSTYKDGRAVSSSYIVAPAPDRKGLLAGANKNLDQSFLKWVPKEAVSFTGFTLEPMTMYDALVAALKAYDEELAKKLLTQLEGMEKQIGFSIRDDLFGALGDTFITWSMPLANIATPPESAFLLKVKDEEKLLKVIKGLTGLSHGVTELEESEKHGIKTYQLRINFDPTNGMGMNPFDVINPTFAFKNGYLVAGFSASDVRRVFQNMDRTEDDPKVDIRGNREFARYADSLPAQVQSLGFTDWKAQFEGYYQILTSVLAFVPTGEDVPIDMSLLPDVSTLTRHLFGAISYSVADGNGYETTSISPFGPEVGLLLAAAAVGVASAFAIGNVRR